MSNKVNILIIEDEGIVAMELQEDLEDQGFEVVGVADNGAEALDIIRNHPVDLVLLDINIAGMMDGVETASQMKKIRNIPFIYLTAYADDETFERAKHTLPSAYITKPFRMEDLYKTIDLAMHHFSLKPAEAVHPGDVPVIKKETADQDTLLRFNDAVFIKQNYRYNKIAYDEILYLKADGNYTYIHTTSKIHVIKYSLQTVLSQFFNTGNFTRVHRSFAINVRHIASFNETSVIIGAEEIPIGKIYRDQFMKLFIK